VILHLSHFSAAFIFSLFASVVFGITQRSDPREMARYGVKCFAWFICGLIAGGWLMWIIKH
jgi:Na+/H+-dicarboxylate symporter